MLSEKKKENLSALQTHLNQINHVEIILIRRKNIWAVTRCVKMKSAKGTGSTLTVYRKFLAVPSPRIPAADQARSNRIQHLRRSMSTIRLRVNDKKSVSITVIN